MNHLLGAVGNGAVRAVLTPQASKRRLVSMRGPDSFKFLQGITTKKIMTLVEADESGEFCDYTAFLTNKGRVLTDALLMFRSTSKSWIIEVPTANLAPLLEHFKQYKMRNRIMIDTEEVNTAYRSWALTATNEQNLKELSLWLLNRTSQMEILFYQDPRFPLSLKLLAPSHVKPIEQLPPLGDIYVENETDTPTIYDYMRNLNGVPEGGTQIISGSSVPFESNFDLMNAIDYDKGCYLGQELVARTHFRGAVRKRFFPLVSLGSASSIASRTGSSTSSIITSLTESELTSSESNAIPQAMLREISEITVTPPKGHAPKATKEIDNIYDYANIFPTEGTPLVPVQSQEELESILSGTYTAKPIGAASASRMSKTSTASSWNVGLGAMRTEDWHASPSLLFYAPPATEGASGTLLKGVKPWWYENYQKWCEGEATKAVAQANDEL